MRARLHRWKRRLFGARPKKGSWTVCSTVAEPAELLFAFVAHYLELGADEVHLFLDDPDQRGLETLAAIKGVRLTVCDAAHWSRLGRARPDLGMMRQLNNANLAYLYCRTEWFFFCDADEFFIADRPVSALLNAVPADQMSCRTAMAERIFRAEVPQNGVFDGLLRLPLGKNKQVLQAVYGDQVKMTTNGLSGHTLGKSFVRTGRDDLRIRIHFPVPMDEKKEARQRADKTLVPPPKLDGGWLVHFDGLTLLHWRLKLLRYYLAYAGRMTKGEHKVFEGRTAARSYQLGAVHDAQGDPDTLAHLTRLVRLDAAGVALLAQAGGILDRKIDPAAAARRRVGPDLQFCAAAFDDSLRQRHGDLIREYGLDG